MNVDTSSREYISVLMDVQLCMQLINYFWLSEDFK